MCYTVLEIKTGMCVWHWRSVTTTRKSPRPLGSYNMNFRHKRMHWQPLRNRVYVSSIKLHVMHYLGDLAIRVMMLMMLMMTMLMRMMGMRAMMTMTAVILGW